MDHLTKTHHYDECTHWCVLLHGAGKKEQACALNPANTHRQTHFTVIYTQHLHTDARTHSHALSLTHSCDPLNTDPCPETHTYQLDYQDYLVAES